MRSRPRFSAPTHSPDGGFVMSSLSGLSVGGMNSVREAVLWVFCLSAFAMLTIGKTYEAPSLVRAYEAFETAIERGDWRRAATFGEAALRASDGHTLIDGPVQLRLMKAVAEAQEKSGNRQRALGLYEEILKAPTTARDEELGAAARAGLARLQPDLTRSFRGAATP